MATTEPAPAAAPVDEVAKEEKDAELPRATVKRLLKPKLVTADDKKQQMQIKEDALIALTESARVFINYITSTAHEYTTEGKRQTMSAEDVFKALDDMEFGDLVEPLREFLKGKGALVSKKYQLSPEASRHGD